MSKAEHAAYMREWRANNQEHREYMRKWREENAERLKEYRRQRYEANREAEIAGVIKWQQKNPLDVLIHSKVHAANNRYEGRICAQDIRDLIDRDGWVCHWCKKPLTTQRDFTLEHLEPRNDPAVLALACHKCNCAKLPTLGLTARLERKEYLARRRDKKIEYDKKWLEENRDRVNELQRARYHAHIEERRAYFREWQRKKRERDKSAGAVLSK